MLKRTLLILCTLGLLSSCNLAMELQRTTQAIHRNQYAIDEDTDAIYRNRDAIEGSSEAIRRNQALIAESNRALEKNTQKIDALNNLMPGSSSLLFGTVVVAALVGLLIFNSILLWKRL